MYLFDVVYSHIFPVWLETYLVILTSQFHSIH